MNELDEMLSDELRAVLTKIAKEQTAKGGPRCVFEEVIWDLIGTAVGESALSDDVQEMYLRWKYPNDHGYP
jgi:hypothetical protein